MPNSPSTDEIVDTKLSVSDIEDLLKDDEGIDNTETDKGRKEDTADKIDKEGSGKDEEEELELKDDEIEENLEIKGPPRKKEIEKEYPGFFKKFPEIEKEYYKAQQFTELIGSVDDARELVQKAEVLDNFETNLSEGNTEAILKQVKENSPESFDKIVDNYLESLAKVDRDSYFSVVESIVKRGIIAALNHSKNTQDEELRDSVVKYYKYMFPQDTEIRLPEKKTVSTEDTKLKQEREAFTRERFETAQDDIQGKIDNIIRSNINNYIDPKDQMTPYVKKNAIKDAMDELENSIVKDPNFKKTVLDPLWKKAHDEKFSRASLDRIKSAYLSKARTLLKPIILKARSEALRGLGSKREDKDRKGPLSVGRTSTSSSERGHNNKVPEKGVKTLDYLNAD